MSMKMYRQKGLKCLIMGMKCMEVWVKGQVTRFVMRTIILMVNSSMYVPM